MAIIALMTDFGTRDYYVAAMKGVVALMGQRFAHNLLKHLGE